MEMRIEYMALEALPPALTNPKGHDIALLREAIRARGFNDPCAINETTGRLVEGHGRVEALKAMRDAGEEPPKRISVRDGAWFVPVVRGVAFDSDEEALAYLLEHNQLSMAAGWEDKELATVLRDLQASQLDVSVLGWSDAMVEKLIRAELDQSTVVEDDVPDLPSNPVSRVGDVWHLGDHMLVVGKCEEELAKHVAKGSAKLMVTDPPYGVSYAAKNQFLNEISRGNLIQTPIEGDHETHQEMSALWLRAWATAHVLLARGGSYYVTAPQGGELLLLLLLSMRDANLPPRHMLIWAKDVHVLGRCDYHYQHEPIVYGWIEGAGHKRIENRSETSLWHIPKPRKSDLHPTMKPVELYARAMRNSSERGDLVLDLFAGSGTAFVAGEDLERRVRGAELTPHYSDVIIQRWEAKAGAKAQRVVHGPGDSPRRKASRAPAAGAPAPAERKGRASGRPSRSKAQAAS